MKHLSFAGVLWCDDDADDPIETDDPRDATCLVCLKRAASFGAAAAMRSAAVESATAVSDAELSRERDEAIRRLNACNDALEAQQAFFCTGCLTLRRVVDRQLNVGRDSWCTKCVPTARTP